MQKVQVIEQIEQSQHHKIWIALTDMDGRLMGKLISREKCLHLLENHGLSFADALFAADIGGSLHNMHMSSWCRGFPDAHAHIDLNTLRKMPWNDNMLCLLADFSHDNSIAAAVCPRSLLKRILEQYADAGYVPVFAQEFEWFNYADNPQQLHAKAFHPLTPLTEGNYVYSVLRPALHETYFNALFDDLATFSVPIDAMHTELGPGLYEASIQQTHALEAADRAALLKTCVKRIAYKYGVTASFMAKPSMQLSGCGGHLHQSLTDAAGKYLFYTDNNEHHMSEVMQSYLAGQLAYLPDLFPMLAPVVNSYKRFLPHSAAPTNFTWGFDNRSVALRVLRDHPESTRIENRIAGADVNPYLAISACLAAGLQGIKEELQLDIPPILDNAYAVDKNLTFPANLQEATTRMKNSKIAKTLLSEAFVDHFVETREWEWQQYMQQVSDWEVKRYFEMV